MVSDFPDMSLASEFSFVFLAHGGGFDDDMRFARSVHGGPTCSKVAIRVYEGMVLLLCTLGMRHV